MKKAGFILLVFAILGTSLIGCSDASTPAIGSGSYTVKYQITGPATTADIVVYTNETRNNDTITNVSIPWEKTIIMGNNIAVACAASYTATGTYTAKIFINGREAASANSSSGQISVSALIK